MGRWHETVAKRKFSMEIVGSIARNVRFGSFVVGNLKEASRETLRFGSLFYEISRKPRTKRSFWKHCSLKFGGSLA